jgi:selenocysteine-specific elongation factor
LANVIIGTAGHIDHGKTTLVRALTGIDTDRLKEEKLRGITIELGFAHLTLPDGQRVAIVDVPGHERFIKNMLAGAAGIDIAMLVIAGDEGVMPQTREHLDIISLLEVKRLIVVITKIDLAEPELLDLVEEEIWELLKETPFRRSPVVRVSAHTGQGLEKLIRLLAEISASCPTREKAGIARLPVDRVFTVQGFGTVVTGTLFNGEITVGDNLEVASKGLKVRIRNLEVHNQHMDKAVAGQRVAVNLAGVDAKDLERGDVLTEPWWFKPTNRIDVSCHLLKSAPWSLKNMTRIRFYQGTKEALGRVILLGREELQPGEKGFLQIVLEEPVVVMRGDNYVLRSYSPLYTIGGGRILEPHAHKHKRSEKNLLEELTLKASGDPAALAQSFLQKRKTPTSLEEVAIYLATRNETAQLIMQGLVEKGALVALSDKDSVYISSQVLALLEERAAGEIKKYLRENPLEQGMNKEILRAKLSADLSQKDFNILVNYWVQHKKLVLHEGQYLAPPGYTPRLEGLLASKICEVEKFYRDCLWQIPGWEQVKTELHLEEKLASQVLPYMLRTGILTPLTEDLYLLTDLVNEGKHKLRTWFNEHEALTVAQARDLLGTTRKIAVPFLEYLDKNKFTIRLGEIRKLMERRP